MATNPKVGLNRKMHDAKMNTIDEMHFDVLKGVTKYRIRKKFLNGEYTLPEFGEDKSKDGRNLERRFTAYWKDMIEKFGEEFEDSREALKSKFIARYTYLYEQALFWDRVNDLILQACLQKWPESVVDFLLDLLSVLHPAYDQRRRFCERYGVKEK